MLPFLRGPDLSPPQSSAANFKLIASDAYWKNGLQGWLTLVSSVCFDGNDLYVIYYDINLQVTILKNGTSFKPKTIPTLYSVPSGALGVVDDDHKCIVAAVSADGYIHIWFGMHSQAMLYYKSVNPRDPSSFAKGTMLGTNEDSVTYPQPFFGLLGEMYFTFRAIGSGDGDQYFYAYNDSTHTWAAATGTSTGGLIISGSTTSPPVSAYMNGLPQFDGNGVCWWSFEFRVGSPSGPDENQYLLGWNGSSFIQYGGSAATIPIDSSYTPIFTISTSAGLADIWSYYIDVNNKHWIIYVKNDAGGKGQIFLLTDASGSWVETQITSDPAGIGIGSPAIWGAGSRISISYNDRTLAPPKSVYTSSTDRFVTTQETIISPQFSPNFAVCYDSRSLHSTGIVNAVWLPFNDVQYGTVYMDTTNPPPMAGQLYLLEIAA